MTVTACPCSPFPLTVTGAPHARWVLLQPVAGPEPPAAVPHALSQRLDAPFLHCALHLTDWDAQLSPWSAPPVFGQTPFAGQAAATLSILTQQVLPLLRRQFAPDPAAAWVLGGYSLAGLFALWAVTQTAAFDAVAAASPSVWFPEWLPFAAEHPARIRAAALSLGDREDRSRNPVLRSVKDCLLRQQALFTAAGLPTQLTWHPGNHFQDAPQRTAQTFAEAVALLSSAQ